MLLYRFEAHQIEWLMIKTAHNRIIINVTPIPKPAAAGDNPLDNAKFEIACWIAGVATISITNARERGTPTPLAAARAYLKLADFSSSAPLKIEMKIHADHIMQRATKMTLTIYGGLKSRTKTLARQTMRSAVIHDSVDVGLNNILFNMNIFLFNMTK